MFPSPTNFWTEQLLSLLPLFHRPWRCRAHSQAKIVHILCSIFPYYLTSLQSSRAATEPKTTYREHAPRAKLFLLQDEVIGIQSDLHEVLKM